MKKVLIIGAGAQGNVISGVLAAADDVGAIALADIDVGRAKEVVQFVGSDKVAPVRLDASDGGAVQELLDQNGFDLVVNATMPAFVRPILKACSRVGVDYLDMASNEILDSSTSDTVQEEFLVEQFEFDAAYRETGHRALILAGGDAGLVNIMARDAVDELDVVDYIGIKDYGIIEADEPVALWSLQTYLEDCAEPAVYWEDGEYKFAPVFSGAEDYYFPPPLDAHGTVYYHSHEEPITIPKFIGKPVGYCDFKLGDPDSETWRFIIEGLGLTDTEPVDIKGTAVSPRDVLFAKIPKTLTPAKCIEMVEQGRLMSRLQLAVDVRGTKDGEQTHFKMWTDSPSVVDACRRIPGTNDVSWITSVPASILSLMLLRGQIHHVGVFPCEVLEQDEREIFFEGIGAWDVEVHRQINPE